MIGLIAGSKMAGDSGMIYLESSFVAVTSVGICCSAFMSIPITMVDYRDKKILKHFYCSPCSPARIPYELFPKGMQLVAGYMPLGVGIRLMKAASVGVSLDSVGAEIAVLLLISVICIAISVKTFRWE